MTVRMTVRGLLSVMYCREFCAHCLTPITRISERWVHKSPGESPGQWLYRHHCHRWRRQIATPGGRIFIEEAELYYE